MADGRSVASFRDESCANDKHLLIVIVLYNRASEIQGAMSEVEKFYGAEVICKFLNIKFACKN